MFGNVPRNIFLGKYLLTVKPPYFEEDFEMLEYILYCCLSNDSTQDIDIFMKTSEQKCLLYVDNTNILSWIYIYKLM